jgi:hypothetical protein
MDAAVEMVSHPMGAGVSTQTTARMAVGFVAFEGAAAGAIVGAVVGSLLSNSRRGTTAGAAIGILIGGVFGGFTAYELKQATQGPPPST